MSTVIAAALSDGFAVVGLANASLKQSSIFNIILEAAQKAFGLAASSSPSSSPSSPLTNQSAVPRRRIRDLRADVAARTYGAASPSYPDFAGIYYNAGYGTAELCSVASTFPSCQSVLNDFRSVDESLSANSTDLFISWNTPLTSHILLAATGGTQYVVFVGTIYPKGYGKDSTPFSTLAAGAIARFVVENGNVIGFGIFSADVDEAGSVEETSAVWFVKQG